MRQPENTAWYLALIIILIASLVVWAVLTLRIDLFTEAMKREETLSIIIVIDDGDKPLLTEVLYFHPVTQNGALVAIPYETGTLLSSVDRVDRLETIYEPTDWDPYRKAVGGLLGHPIDFVIRLDTSSFERLVDHLGGIDVFIPKAVDDTVNGVRYLFPPGGVELDGAKARTYIEYRPRGEVIAERTDREHRITQSLLRSLGDLSDRLLSDEVFPYIRGLIDSDLDDRSLATFISAISSMDTERLIFQGILGNRRTLDGKEVVFPYYDGKLIKETIQRIMETLVRSDIFGEDLLTVRIEILNGTGVTGLASRTAQLYKSYGFRIASVMNAERNDYERTVVLDRRGSPDAAKRVAELIRCEQIHSQIDENRDETIDVTIILGKDFDGRYVKK
ncbi:MAG: LCP family protein [Spirochaetaceae bacterium]|nr:LCP family protein [Spirochaetaceae bacterium]